MLGLVGRLGPGVRIVLIAAVLATGVFDCWENFRMLTLLWIAGANLMSEAALSRPVSLVKWALFAFDLLLVGFGILRETSRSTSRSLLIAMSGFVFLGSLSAAIGIFQNNVLGLSVLFVFPALLVAAWIWKPPRAQTRDMTT